MLGFLENETADVEIAHSKRFLVSCFKERGLDLSVKKGRRAFDVGGGIGRVSKDLLQHFFEEIDLLD